jgi:GDP-L-fucose synthase
MKKTEKIYVAGHRGLVGSALIRQLKKQGYSNVIFRTHAELDLTNQAAVEVFFKKEKPKHVFLAAAKVGGIHANNTYPAEFLYDNLSIQSNVIHQSYLNGVKRLLFLGSSCIYPKDCPQPIKEEYLLTSPLESTNRPYALAKIAGIEMCWDYNRQYGTQYLAAMPTNLYGIGDNYHPENSHVIPALIRKFHEGKLNDKTNVTVWGTGKPRREFLYNTDLADACLKLMQLKNSQYQKILNNNVEKEGLPLPPLVNIGYGSDITIKELAKTIKNVVGYKGGILFDESKPDGTSQKLLNSSVINDIGWRASTELIEGIALAYKAFLEEQV